METEMEEQPELQRLNYFEAGNTYTGSKRKFPEQGIASPVLRYLVKPDLENEKLNAFAWSENVCFDRAQEKEESNFPLNKEGLEAVGAWLTDKFKQI